MSTRRTCPLCTLRPAGVVDPTCAVCNGYGYLTLGDRALREYTGEAVSTAVHLALEITARQLDRQPHSRTQSPGPALADALGQLTRFGILNPPKVRRPPGPPPVGRNPGPPAALVREATGKSPDHTDQLLIRAHFYPYAPSARPGSRGLPLMSENHHPSSLARVGNPQPFDTTTTKTLHRQARDRYNGRTLANYALGITR